MNCYDALRNVERIFEGRIDPDVMESFKVCANETEPEFAMCVLLLAILQKLGEIERNQKSNEVW